MQGIKKDYEYTVIILAVLAVLNSPYLGWNFGDPEIAVVGTTFHVFEWLYVRIAPIIIVGGIIGAFLTHRKD